MTAPPGYAEAARAASPSLALPAAFVCTLIGALGLALVEVGMATPHAYAPSASTGTAVALAALGVAVGVVVERRVVRRVARRQCGATSGVSFTRALERAAATYAMRALAVLSLLASLSGYVFTLTFSRGEWLSAAMYAWPVVIGAAVAGALSAALHGFGPGFVAADGIVYLLNPLRALVVLLVLGVVLAAFPVLGVVRRAALIGTVLAGLALVARSAAAWFGVLGPVRRFDALVGAAPCVALAALIAAERVVPLADVQRHTGDVLAVLDGPRGHHAFVRAQGGLLVFTGELLASTSTDATRFAEALVHPALAAASARRAVLLFDDGAGAAPREIMRWRDVEHARFVPMDPALATLARNSTWLRPLAAAALADPRLVLDTTEPSVFLQRAERRYDVIVANFGDPTSYLAGKYFSVGVLALMRARLAPGGLLALAITSPERTPETHASIERTLLAAGYRLRLYRAPLPTLGEWGFALAADARDAAACAALDRADTAPVVPNGTELVTTRTLPTLFAAPPRTPIAKARPSYLYNQPVVETYQREEHALTQ